MASFARALRVCTLFASAALLPAACGGSNTGSGPRALVASATPSSSASSRLLTPADIAARETPSVVSIRSHDSLGSGFVVKKDGWIATNLHVIAEARELSVTFAGGGEFPVVEVIAVDMDHDLALIKIDKSALPELVVGDSDRVKAGDRIVAIGHPLGLEDTVSNGLVSAIRNVSPSLTLLQISAPIAPGSSGGPLIDEEGRVIGIATAVSREGQNLAFGVPTRYLAELMGKPAPMSWADFVAARSPALPAMKRDVPHHELSLLTGCGDGDLKLLGQMLSDAIDVGAPLFNGGNFAACFHVYEGASTDAEHKLGAGCSGPKRALATGRAKADALHDPAAQAWAMRDSFDGLLDVIVRKLDHP
jgi:serine protease Do